MYAGGGEAADQTVRLMLAGCETVVRLGGSGLRNTIALTLALARNNKQLSGKVNLNKMLKETRDLRLFPMTGEQYRQFAKLAKPQKLLYSVIRDKDSGQIDVLLPVTELERVNLIFEKMLYNMPVEPKQQQAETETKEQAPSESVEMTEPEKEQAPSEPVDMVEPEKEQIEQSKGQSEQVEMVEPEKASENDPKKGSRLDSDLNATRRNSSTWSGKENTIQTTSEREKRPSVLSRLKAFQAEIEKANSLEPTRSRKKTKTKEQAR